MDPLDCSLDELVHRSRKRGRNYKSNNNYRQHYNHSHYDNNHYNYNHYSKRRKYNNYNQKRYYESNDNDEDKKDNYGWDKGWSLEQEFKKQSLKVNIKPCNKSYLQFR